VCPYSTVPYRTVPYFTRKPSRMYVPPRAGVAGLAGSKEARASTGALCLGRPGAPPLSLPGAPLATPALPAAAHPELARVCLSALQLGARCTSAAASGARGLSQVLPRYCIVRLRRWACCPRPRCWARLRLQPGWQARPAQATQASLHPVQPVQPLCRPCVSARCSSPAQAQGGPCPCSSGREQLLEQVR